MSTNNLTSHLQWLLEAEPFLPKLQQSTTRAQQSSVDVDGSQVDVLEHDALQSRLVSANIQRSPARMARLRAAPSPKKKPQLASQLSCSTSERVEHGTPNSSEKTKTRSTGK